ncbi:MAG: glycyl-radical enzyme activating protein [Bacillota bacterium]
MRLVTGIIFDVKKYSIHDGPGIRTTVFFKGCPLNCVWCHNPEGQAKTPEVMFWPNRCRGCLACVRSCPRGAIVERGGALETTRDKCNLCGTCAAVCHYEGRVIVGRRATVGEVMDEIEKDVVFYDDSGGGVTFSGGEPLMQPEFLDGLLELCKQREVHTAVDTCGLASAETFLCISPKVDLFLYDLKTIDSEKHRKLTGQPNEVILENLRLLSANHSNVVVRFPLIPGLNDDDETIDGLGKFVSSLGRGCSRRIDILPYHRIGADKYTRLGRTYALAQMSVPTAELVDSVAERLRRLGLEARIGG